MLQPKDPTHRLTECIEKKETKDTKKNHLKIIWFGVYDNCFLHFPVNLHKLILYQITYDVLI